MFWFQNVAYDNVFAAILAAVQYLEKSKSKLTWVNQEDGLSVSINRGFGFYPVCVHCRNVRIQNFHWTEGM